MTNCILSTDQITKSFLFQGKQTTVLKQVNICVAESEFVCIVGASGCGKTTLLEILAGITKPDSGIVNYRGMNITGKSGYLGYMPQEDLLFPWYSILNNALIPVRIKKSDLKSATKRIYELAEIFGLENHIKHHPYQLSGGLKQRAAFLRTCMTGSTLWLLDEPFANLDALTRITLQNWLKSIQEQLNLTIVMVTHDLEEAFTLSDRIYIMSNDPESMNTVLSREHDRYHLEHYREQCREKILSVLLK